MVHPAISPPAEDAVLCDGWFDPIEAGLRIRVRSVIETLLEEELTAVLLRLEGLLASGQILMRKVDGWASPATPVADHQPVAIAAWRATIRATRPASPNPTRLTTAPRRRRENSASVASLPARKPIHA